MSPLHNHVLTLLVKSVFWDSKYNGTQYAALYGKL